MVPEIVLLAGLSSSGLPRIPRAMSLVDALIESCDLQEDGKEDQAIDVLRLANDAAELSPVTTFPPEY